MKPGDMVSYHRVEFIDKFPHTKITNYKGIILEKCLESSKIFLHTGMVMWIPNSKLIVENVYETG